MAFGGNRTRDYNNRESRNTTIPENGGGGTGSPYYLDPIEDDWRGPLLPDSSSIAGRTIPDATLGNPISRIKQATTGAGSGGVEDASEIICCPVENASGMVKCISVDYPSCLILPR